MRVRQHHISRGVWLLALACLAAAIGAEGGRWRPQLDVLADLTPIWGALAALCGMVGALHASALRPTTLAASAAAVALAVTLVAPELTRPIPRAEPGDQCRRLRVIQLNLGGSSVPDARRVALWLADKAPDVIFLDDWDPAIRAELLALGFAWAKGTAHTAIAARGALGRQPPGVPPAWSVKTAPDMAQASLGTGADTIELVAAHPERPVGGNLGEVSVVVAGLARLIRMYPSADRLILAGDINRTPWSFALRRLDRSLPLQRVDRAAFTWPARIGASDWPAAILPLDHVYAGSAWRLVNAGVGPSVGATHRPLVVDLEDCSER